MIYTTLGLAFFLLGCIHTLLPTREIEIKAIITLQRSLNHKRIVGFFQEIWFFGRTVPDLIILILLICLNWRSGILAAIVFGMTAGIETLVKRFFNRPRPFKEKAEIKMLQPREPGDPSFPSGDALRIWYLTPIISIILGSSLPFWVGSLTLAFLVSLGRVIMGVHYPSDVLAGSGLGLLGAGTTIWLWGFFQLL